MLINYNEYQKMFEVEQQLWWYKVLHEKVLKTIETKFKKNKGIKILDAGCGTGGLISFLMDNGYKNIEGFDFSNIAVDFCKQRNLFVVQLDVLLLDNSNFTTFDIIILNDVLYQFEDDQIKKIFKSLKKKLNQKGILISNNNAFNIFHGTHDIAVGGKHRFKIGDFKMILRETFFKIQSYTYWSLLLSPLILVLRITQKIKIKLHLVDFKNITSDLFLPSNIVNQMLYKIVKLEEKFFKKSFFGNSLFMIIENQNI